MSRLGVCYANDPQKGGAVWRPRLRLMKQPLFEVIDVSSIQEKWQFAMPNSLVMLLFREAGGLC